MIIPKKREKQYAGGAGFVVFRGLDLFMAKKKGTGYFTHDRSLVPLPESVQFFQTAIILGAIKREKGDRLLFVSDWQCRRLVKRFVG